MIELSLEKLSSCYFLTQVGIEIKSKGYLSGRVKGLNPQECTRVDLQGSRERGLHNEHGDL